MINSRTLIEPIHELMDAGWMDRSKYVGKHFEAIDYLSATDHHPGTESHRQFGTFLAQWLIERYDSELRAVCADRISRTAR